MTFKVCSQRQGLQPRKWNLGPHYNRHYYWRRYAEVSPSLPCPNMPFDGSICVQQRRAPRKVQPSKRKVALQAASRVRGIWQPKIHGTKFDEPGYIAIPDCLWGDTKYGLEFPVNVSGVPLYMIKRSNATYGHYGEMSGGQPWVY